MYVYIYTYKYSKVCSKETHFEMVWNEKGSLERTVIIIYFIVMRRFFRVVVQLIYSKHSLFSLH